MGLNLEDAGGGGAGVDARADWPFPNDLIIFYFSGHGLELRRRDVGPR